MEETIMNLFEQRNLKAGEIIPLRVINQHMATLNHVQRAALQNALQSLLERNYFTYEDGTTGIECLRLTEIGFNSIYSNSLTVEELKREVLGLFFKQHSRAGHIVMRVFHNFQNLNPIEQNRLLDAINTLNDQGYILIENRSDLRLTQLGEDTIYQ
jgi:hypothetical protein